MDLYRVSPEVMNPKNPESDLPCGTACRRGVESSLPDTSSCQFIKIRRRNLRRSVGCQGLYTLNPARDVPLSRMPRYH